MNKIIAGLIFIMQLSIPLNGQQILELSKNWSFKKSDTDDWLPCTIPGTSFTALLENQKIPDPFYSDNEKKIQWIGESNWSFKTIFNADEELLNHENIFLECAGLDTYCSVFVNGKLVGKANNAFRHWDFDIKHLLITGSNELQIDMESASKMADSLYSKLETKLPGEKRVMLRKPQYHFGWDFGPTFISCGITAPIKISAWNSINLLDASIHTLSLNDSFADLLLMAKIFIQDSASEFKIKLNIDQDQFEFPIDKRYGFQLLEKNIRIYRPVLWWPNGSGRQHLYPCHIQIFQKETIYSEKKFHLGIRTISLINERDSLGTTFYFLVNGKKIFCKGANYIPPDILHSDQNPTDAIVGAAAQSHFNMLRVWGGGSYEKDSFYKACDEKGILVWQDFMYACGMYPGDSAFLLNASIEAEEQVFRLSKYACIALWCGNNENNEGWHRWGWQLLISEENQKRIWEDYQNLFNSILPKAVRKFSNNNSYRESSPLYGRGDDKFLSNGDAHDWGLWHDEMEFEKLEKRIPRFMSEFGFQSLPDLATIKQFAPSSQLDLLSDAMLNHQKHPRGNKLIQQYLERDFPAAKDFESLVYLNQLTQSEGISKIIRAHRKAKPYCMGSLYWQFNDCWPGISWSGIDYYGKWKALQHQVKQTFNPVLFIAEKTETEINISAVSDLLEPINSDLEIYVQDFLGNYSLFQRWEGTLDENSSTNLIKIPFELDKAKFTESNYILLKWKYQDQNCSQAYFLDRLKNLRLPDPILIIDSLQKTEDGYLFNIKSINFAKSVYLLEDLTKSFFPNYFDIHPNETKEIKCITTNKNLQIADLKMISLFDFLKK